MAAQIRPNRLEVSDRFPMLGFTIRTDGSPQRAEVAIATDPSLFRAEKKTERTSANFYSSRAGGPLVVPRSEAVYVVPPEVLAGFIGQERLYFGLATTPERNGATQPPQVTVMPGEGSPYISLRGLTGRSLQRVRVIPSRQQRAAGYGGNGKSALEWAGDAATPGQVPAAGTPAPVSTGGNGTAPAVAPHYDDGFGPLAPTPPPVSTNAPAGSEARPAAPPAVPTTPTAQGQAYALSSEIPLDPGNGGLSIGSDVLEVGDIIVTTTAAAVSGLIRFGTGSQVSHTMLYVGQGTQVIDATSAGVRLRPLAEALSDATVAVAFRYPGLSEAQRQIIADKAAEHIGRPYDYWGIVRQASFQIDSRVCNVLPASAAEECRNFCGRVDVGRGTDTEFFCSELVIAAYQAAGVPITSTPPEWTSPDDLAQFGLRSGVLAYVGHLKAPPYERRQSIWESLGLSAQESAALAYESFSLNWDDLQLINQPTNQSCWATAAAMVLGWRDQVSVTPEFVALCGGRTTAAGLPPSQKRQFATEIGLRCEEPQSYAIDDFRRLLETCGPLWVGVTTPNGNHAIVVTGMYSDGAADGSDTFVRIADPWDRNPGTPGAPGPYLGTHNTGSRYILTWNAFVREYEDRVTVSRAGTVNVQIVHAGGTDGRVPNRQTTPAGYAMAAGRGARPLTVQSARAFSAASAEQVIARAGEIGSNIAELVTRLLSQGVSPADLQAFLGSSTPLASAASAAQALPQGRGVVRTLGTQRRPAHFPSTEVASWWKKELVLTTLFALSPALVAVRAAANRYNLSVAIGPTASVGFLIGGGVGAGIIFAPDDEVGFYGQFDILGGLIDSASVEIQCTIVSGGIESFSGISWAVAAEVDLGVSVSAQVLFDTSLHFQGVTFGLGLGLGIEPIQVFFSLQGTAAESLALTQAVPAPSARPLPPHVQTRRAVAMDEATGAIVPPPFPGAVIERVDGASGNVRWQLDQLRGFKLPPGMAPDAVSCVAPAVRLSDWPYLEGRDGAASLPLTVDWEFAAGGVGNIRVAAGEARNAEGVTLDVRARILDQTLPPSPAGPAVAALRVQIEYRFTAPDGATPLAITELILHGDGQLERRSTWQTALVH